MIKTILFDLDGTLLPMDQEEFVKLYFGELARTFVREFEPEQLTRSIWDATKKMIQNGGEKKNEDVFWTRMSELYGNSIYDSIPAFDAFYHKEFQSIQKVCPANPKSRELIDRLKDNYSLILATNPLFPAIATKSRVAWAGLDETDFELITTYENSRACKPSLVYYENILKEFDLDPSECLMVGNDVDEDMVCARLGMHVFLATDHLIDRSHTNINLFPHGNFDDLIEYLEWVNGKRL